VLTTLLTLALLATPLQRAAEFNGSVPGLFTIAQLDSMLAGEQAADTAQRVGDWAQRMAAAGDDGYCFGLADGGYVAEGRLAPGRRFDCISFVYRTTELARAHHARHALVVALDTRFAGAPRDSVVDDRGEVDYDRPEHLDYSVDMIRSGHWGRDVTAGLAGAAPDAQGSSRYAAGAVVTAPETTLDPDELHHGDVIWFVLSSDDATAARLRHEYGLMIGHAGVVVRQDGEVWLVHAASKPLPGWYESGGVVRVPLEIYLQRVERYSAVMVTRF